MPTEDIEPSSLLRSLWEEFDFDPNENQRKAILHLDGPLYLPAGPGSGKTRVLLWRVVNLIVQHNVRPDEIFLSTFTEKAAKQLRDGLRTFLTAAAQKTNKAYDISKLYVGTIHSLCRRLLIDRRVSEGGHRRSQPVLLDELGQYLFIRRKSNWTNLENSPRDGPVTNTHINEIFGDRGRSRHTAIASLIMLFNRLSEEMVDPNESRRRTQDKDMAILLDLYEEYKTLLAQGEGPGFTDLSLLQKVTVDYLSSNESSSKIFKHVIIDEYQDTNAVQEELFFILAKGSGNLCVVGDDDQALYRFRGATVENFVEFPERCKKILGTVPRRLDLEVNYRSCKEIVSFSSQFIKHGSCDWTRQDGTGFYRVADKRIKHDRECPGVDIVYSTHDSPDRVASEIAKLVRDLINQKKVEDPNQVAYLFPSLKSPQVERMRHALEEVDLKVYAPRARTFLEVQESIEVFGLILLLFDDTTYYRNGFSDWAESAINTGKKLCDEDPHLRDFVSSKKRELEETKSDFDALSEVLVQNNWSDSDPYRPAVMQEILVKTRGISAKARKSLESKLFHRSAEIRLENKRPFTLKYVLTRASSVDWNFLDIFYQLCGFKHFKEYFDLAESGVDEGPICNLSLISQYIARYLDEYTGIISGNSMKKGVTQGTFVGFLYVLYRREETEYEDANDPFPKGRIPFITIHQAKGLEFPVVVLANPRKDPKKQMIEEMVAPLLSRSSEPLEKMPVYDLMRMFYVALSRAKNLLIIPYFRGQGQRMNQPFEDLMSGKPKIPAFDISLVPSVTSNDQELPLSYSYTGDFILYQKCPRQYMVFRKYGFIPSRSQTMFFGSLVHQTLEDLHQMLINERRTP